MVESRCIQMGFLLLFSLLLVFGFALASFSFYRYSKQIHWLYWGIAFSVYSVVLILELVLGFGFNEQVLRLWYWLRYMLLLPLFGLGLLHYVYKDHAWRKYVEWGLGAFALAGLGLVALTAITQALDWYDPAQSIYAQYVDLLARNRPTRWLTHALNGFGIGAALLAFGVGIIQKSGRKKSIPLVGVLIAFATILLQAVLIEQGLTWAVWLVPLFSCTLLFIGMGQLAEKQKRPSLEEVNRSGWWRSLKWHHIVIALVLVWGLQVRLGSYGDPSLSISNYDSGEFIRAAQRDLFSLEFFTSNRPATIVLFYKLLEPASGYELTNLSSPAENIGLGKTLQPGLDSIVLGQMWVAIVSWSVLAIAISRRVRNPLLKIIAVAFTLGFAYSPNLVDWDSILLSESLALSLFALMLAATVELVARLVQDKKRTRPATLGMLILWGAVMVLWVLSRDTNSYMLLIMLAVVVALLLLPLTRQQLDLRVMLAIAVFLTGLFIFQNRTLAASDRWVNPFFNNMIINVFPYPERMAYFEEQGMPLTDEVLAYRDAGVNQDGFWEIPYLMDWVYTQGYSAYSRYLITHPVYTVQTVWNNFGLVFSENVQPFFSPDYDNTPEWMYYLGNLLHPLSASVMLVVAILTGMLAWGAVSALNANQMALAGIFVTMLIGLFAMLAVSVLGDGISTIRHAMVSVVPFRLFVWLLGILVMDQLLLPNAVSGQD